MTIAYEPVWAIGTGRAASPDQAVPVHRMIRRTINELSGSDAGNQVRILYGGSVTPQNIADFLASEEIDGALVGGACLDPACFATLISVALGSKPPRPKNQHVYSTRHYSCHRLPAHDWSDPAAIRQRCRNWRGVRWLKPNRLRQPRTRLTS